MKTDILISWSRARASVPTQIEVDTNRWSLLSSSSSSTGGSVLRGLIIPDIYYPFHMLTILWPNSKKIIIPTGSLKLNGNIIAYKNITRGK